MIINEMKNNSSWATIHYLSRSALQIESPTNFFPFENNPKNLVKNNNPKINNQTR
jgi:hypothetical protein